MAGIQYRRDRGNYPEVQQATECSVCAAHRKKKPENTRIYRAENKVGRNDDRYDVYSVGCPPMTCRLMTASRCVTA